MRPSSSDSSELHELGLSEYDDSTESSPLTAGMLHVSFENEVHGALTEIRRASVDHLPTNRGSNRSVSPVLQWSLLALAGLIVVDLVALFYVCHMFNTVFEDRGTPSSFEFADPYIGLKALYESGEAVSSTIEPIINRPRLSAQVYANEPDRPAPRGERDHWIDGWGTVSPNERRLHVTPEVHTIAQFRAIDFGMEDCHLVLTIPPATDESGHANTQLEAGASFSMHLQSHLDVFRLETDAPIDPAALTYRTRPRVAEKVATVHAHAISEGGEVAIYRFPCARASLHTFEVACTEGFPECLVDAWSSQNTTLGKSVPGLWGVDGVLITDFVFLAGINVIQYQTV
ncbi:hypothetical protein GSI_03276 [Ganoderma sinense ZZ0214-1]|uniref:Ubiquitin 3 binding protein But2 C-terminal domain-containing protein n=1 Tax=Ganoderma sinense ZZ0214-1 TaxID=1077348 RepID=A0A2G8SL69_9APHY|nr:hypothetical protein GSI_03276 [Ganoderma sinense ZZ0214-1]